MVSTTGVNIEWIIRKIPRELMQKREVLYPCLRGLKSFKWHFSTGQTTALLIKSFNVFSVGYGCFLPGDAIPTTTVCPVVR